MSNAKKRNVDSTETPQQKVERLRTELEEAEKSVRLSAADKLADDLNAFYKKKSAVTRIQKAIDKQLFFGIVLVDKNLNHQLYSPLQNGRYIDAFSVAFTGRGGRGYVYAMTASNSDEWENNRLELRVVHPPSEPAHAYPCKVMAPDLTSSEHDYGLAEMSRCGGFTAAMLPFDDELNALLAADESALRMFDVLLLMRVLEIVRAFCNFAQQNAPQGSHFDFTMNVLHVALHNFHHPARGK
jgi:hypothetical protein